jgi:hypothetical protein
MIALFVCLCAFSVVVPVTKCQQLPRKLDQPLGFEENRGQALFFGAKANWPYPQFQERTIVRILV